MKYRNKIFNNIANLYTGDGESYLDKKMTCRCLRAFKPMQKIEKMARVILDIKNRRKNCQICFIISNFSGLNIFIQKLYCLVICVIDSN